MGKRFFFSCVANTTVHDEKCATLGHRKRDTPFNISRLIFFFFLLVFAILKQNFVSCENNYLPGGADIADKCVSSIELWDKQYFFHFFFANKKKQKIEGEAAFGYFYHSR